MRAVVFGGAGFLGSFVADALSDAGHEVVVFDRRPSPYLRAGQAGVVGDITDPSAVVAAVAGADVIYHYAGIADISESSENPVETIRVNVLGTTILLEAARKTGVKRFVFASTLYVYSQQGAFYRSGKQACELIIEDYERAFGLPYTIIRYGSLYGPRATGNNWIHQVLQQALTEGRLVRVGDGDEIREYIHVWDAAKSSVDALADEFKNTSVIISGQQAIRIADLLVMIREMLGNTVTIEYRTPDEAVARNLHYQMTPYAFQPRVALKLIRTSYLDLGQGILSLLHEIHADSEPSERPAISK